MDFGQESSILRMPAFWINLLLFPHTQKISMYYEILEEILRKKQNVIFEKCDNAYEIYN